MSRTKKALLFTLTLLPVAIVAGYFAARYSLKLLDPALVAQAIEQVGSETVLLAVTVVQTVLYALVCGFFGYILSDRIGLMRSFRVEKKPLLITLTVSVLFGAILSLDAWTFGKWIPEIGASYAAEGTIDADTWITSILYGGIIEEVMLRLFLMSLIAFLLWKLFFCKRETVPTGVLIAANLIAAALFAAGHLPATAQTIGTLTPMHLLRCFLLNGAFGMLFGRLYRKYGIQYAMLSHALLHIVSRTIWLIAF